MYCGSNKTALASQRQIAAALMDMIRRKPYAQITVSELCREAGISRQTFYTLFSSRENVVVFTLQEQYCYAPAREVRQEYGLEALCRGYSEYIWRNRAFIKLLAENHIDYLLYDSISEALSQCGCFLKDMQACARRYAVSFYAGGLAQVAKQYALEERASGAEDLARMLMALFRGELFDDMK